MQLGTLILLSMDLDKDGSRRAEPSWEPAAESGAREDAVTEPGHWPGRVERAERCLGDDTGDGA